MFKQFITRALIALSVLVSSFAIGADASVYSVNGDGTTISCTSPYSQPICSIIASPVITGTFTSKGFILAPAGTATSSANYSSSQLLFQNSVWSGTAPVTDYWTLIMGTGNNLNVEYNGVATAQFVYNNGLNLEGNPLTTGSSVYGATSATINGSLSTTDITLDAIAGQVALNNATSNMILWNATGDAPPSYTTRSVGTKLVLWPNLGSASVDYAIGIQNSTLWNSIPSSGQQFLWYAGTTSIASLSGAGNLSINGTLNSGHIYSNADVEAGGTNTAAAPTQGQLWSEPSATSGFLGFGSSSTQYGALTADGNGSFTFSFANNVPANLTLASSGILTAGGATFNGSSSNLNFNGSSNNLNFNGSSFNLISYDTAGVAPPSYSTRSAGTKIVLYPDLSASTGDFAIGIENATLWNSIPSSCCQFQWYAGTTVIATLSGTGTWTTSSDARFKQNIGTTPYGLDTLMKLHPRIFTWRTTGTRDLGFIAQEVQPLIPEAVHKMDDKGHLGINYNAFAPVVIKAIQEQQHEIEKIGASCGSPIHTTFFQRFHWLFTGDY